MQFEIVTDSSSNLVEEMIDDFGLHVLPLTFMVDGQQYQSYLKGEHTDLKQFYTMMREGKVITTSLPNLAESEDLLRGLLDALHLMRTGVAPAFALDMGITNKAFDSYEQGLIRDVIATRIPAKLESRRLFTD